jgi:sulfoxide reductase catalytic subunit YedY
MLIRRAADIAPSEVTPRRLPIGRREFLQADGIAAAATRAQNVGHDLAAQAADGRQRLAVGERMVTTIEPPAPYSAVTGYNDFYEFGTDKSDPAKYGGSFKSQSWSVTVEGECAKPGVYGLEDILKPHVLEERIYRMR